MSVTPTGSILTQSENYFPRFSQCIRRCEIFRSLAALEVIFTLYGGACWRENCRFWALLQKITIVFVNVRASEGQGEPISIPGALRTSCWITLNSAKLTLRSRVSEKTDLWDMEVKNRKWKFASRLLSKSLECNLFIEITHTQCPTGPTGAGARL